MARDFDGVDDLIDPFAVGAGAIDNALSTWAFWFITDINIGATTLVMLDERTTADARRQTIRAVAPTTAGFKMRLFQDTNGTDGNWTTTNDISKDAWHHLAITYDRGALTNDPVMYVDGVSVAVTETTTPTMVIQTGDARLGIGDFAGVGNINGTFGEIAIWNVLLTADEIAALARGINPTRVRSSALEVYIPLLGTQSPEIEIVVGTTATVTGAVLADHPPRAMPPLWMFDSWRGAFTAAGAPPAVPDMDWTGFEHPVYSAPNYAPFDKARYREFLEPPPTPPPDMDWEPHEYLRLFPGRQFRLLDDEWAVQETAIPAPSGWDDPEWSRWLAERRVRLFVDEPFEFLEIPPPTVPDMDWTEADIQQQSRWYGKSFAYAESEWLPLVPPPPLPAGWEDNPDQLSRWFEERRMKLLYVIEDEAGAWFIFVPPPPGVGVSGWYYFKHSQGSEG